MGQLDWRGNEFIAHLTGVCSKRLDAAADVVAVRMRELISEPYPPASTPGTEPHLRTGNLKKRVGVTKPSPLVRRIGSTAKYSIYLELGTSKMAPRPFGLKSLMQSAGTIRQVVTGGSFTAVAR